MIIFNILNKKFNSDKIINKFMVIFLIFTMSAASFEGFFVKWTFRDDSKFSFQAILDGSAHRPFVYRQLIPIKVTGITDILPEHSKTKIIEKLEEHNLLNDKFKQVHLEPEYMLEYYFAYAIAFLCMFFSTLVWRKLCTEITGDSLAGTAAALIFALVFPLFETVGGYFYDLPELLFFSLAALFAWRGTWWALILITPFAELNKEAFLFFLITLYPILRRTQTVKKSTISIGASVLIAGLTYLVIHSMYDINPGGTVKIHYEEAISNILPLLTCVVIYFAQKNIKAIDTSRKRIAFVICSIAAACLIVPSFTKFFNCYFRFGHTYSVASGERIFLPHLLMIFWIVKNTWKKVPIYWKRHTFIALVINIPLWLLFCSPGELRNLSMLYPSFILMVCIYLSQKFKDYMQTRINIKSNG